MNARAAAIAAGLVVGGVLAYYLVRGARAAAAAAGQLATSINPASPDNIINRSVEAVGQGLSGDPSWTLGGAIYDLTHNDPLLPPPAGIGNKSGANVPGTHPDQYFFP